jgi:hypothetical protein
MLLAKNVHTEHSGVVGLTENKQIGTPRDEELQEMLIDME